MSTIAQQYSSPLQVYLYQVIIVNSRKSTLHINVARNIHFALCSPRTEESPLLGTTVEESPLLDTTANLGDVLRLHAESVHKLRLYMQTLPEASRLDIMIHLSKEKLGRLLDLMPANLRNEMREQLPEDRRPLARRDEPTECTANSHPELGSFLNPLSSR
ncbi:hypothetical protein BC835DRAFT_620907 [Cytidiella melzeri]|nr:hypothetical protein BC835DRAFT_620907 [Cytidiella melzeri]